jgi:hypothetical protein
VLEAREDVAVVGGAQVAVARGSEPRARGIARGLNNRFAMGGAAYRSGGRSGPTETVYLGAFRTADLRAVGGWDERFPTNQDFDLNRRMGRYGLVWFEGDLATGYVPRVDVGQLWRQYHRFGRWKVRYWRTTGDRPMRRQRLLVGLPLVSFLLALLVVARRPGAVLPFATLGVVGLALVDDRGIAAPAPIPVRAWAAATNATTSFAWWTGVVHEALRPGR